MQDTSLSQITASLRRFARFQVTIIGLVPLEPTVLRPLKALCSATIRFHLRHNKPSNRVKDIFQLNRTQTRSHARQQKTSRPHSQNNNTVKCPVQCRPAGQQSNTRTQISTLRKQERQITSADAAPCSCYGPQAATTQDCILRCTNQPYHPRHAAESPVQTQDEPTHVHGT
jgi:hypothetical protein